MERHFILLIFTSFLMFATAAAEKVVGGTPTTNKEHPWQLSLQVRSGGHLCGAMLIKEDVVLTAAHCLGSFRARDLRLKGQSTTGERRRLRRLPRVEKIHIHPDYKSSLIVAHDIAVLTLKRPVTLSDHLQTIAIPVGNDIGHVLEDDFKDMTGQLVSTGWGATSPPATFPIFSEQLMQVEVRPIGVTKTDLNDEQFNSELKEAFNLDDELINFVKQNNSNVLLTTGMIPETGNCTGDSGGPLVYYESGKEPMLIGVTSYGFGGTVLCKGLIGFTNIQAYADWIQNFL